MPARITDKGNGKYLLFVSLGYDGNGKQIYRSKTVAAKSMKDAQKQYDTFKASLGKVTEKAMKLHDFYTYYNENYEQLNLAPGTIERNRYLFNRIDTALGHKTIDKIEAKDLILFFDMLRRAGQKQNSIVKHYQYLHTLFAKAVQWQMIAYNPCDHVDTPKKEKTEKVILDIESCLRFLTFVDKEADLIWRTSVYIAIYAGLRRGEIFGLQFKHIDEINNIIFVQQEVLYAKDKGLYLKPSTKTYKNRMVSVPQFVIDLIKNRKEQILAEKELLHNKWQGAEDINEDFICCNEFGAMSYGNRFTSWLAKFTKKHDFPHITPHSFRHMTATFLISSGVDIQTVAGKLGHSSAGTTLRSYSHLLLSAEKSSTEVLEKALAR